MTCTNGESTTSSPNGNAHLLTPPTDEQLAVHLPNPHTRRAVARALRDIVACLPPPSSVNADDPPIAARLARAVDLIVERTPPHNDRRERWKRLHAAINFWWYRTLAVLDAPVRPLRPTPPQNAHPLRAPPPRVPTPAEVAALVAAADRRSVRCGILFRLLFTTGVRIGAARDLTWAALRAPHTPRVVCVREKGDIVRPLLLGADLRARLDALWSAERPAPTTLVFASRGRTTISVRQLCNWWDAAWRAAAIGPPGSHPHTARHYVVHRLFDCGNPLALIAKFLGHRSAATTERYYLRLSFDEILARIRLPDTFVS